MQGEVHALQTGQTPAIDLSHDELVGQPWYGVNFRWLTAFMPGIDLRGAELGESTWGKRTTLSNSYLQCADLQGANLRRVNLAGADLRGANLKGAHFQRSDLAGADLRGAFVAAANFQYANIKGMKVKRLYGTAKWSHTPQRLTTLPVKKWDQNACLEDRKIDDQPTSVSSHSHKKRP